MNRQYKAYRQRQIAKAEKALPYAKFLEPFIATICARRGGERADDLIPHIGHLLDTGRLEITKPLKSLALPSGIEPLSPP
jgi:hypothetical protein